MINLQYLLSINAFVTGIVALIFGLLVISKNRKNIINKTLFLLTLATAFWSFSYWRWLLVYDNESLALFWIQMLSIGSIFVPVFTFHWIITLLGISNQKINLYLKYVAYFFAFIFLFFVFSPNFIDALEPYKNIFSFWPKAGFLYTLYLFFIYFGLVLYSLYLIVKSYRNSAGLKRVQLKFVLIGAILGLGGGATNFFLWYDIPILPFGNFLVILYPILFSYSIIVHRFMDIRIVMRRYSVFIFAFASIIIPAVAIKYYAIIHFPEHLFFIDSSVLILGMVCFKKTKETYYKIANKYFFSSLYDSGKVIAGISNKLRTTLSINKIYNYIYEDLDNAFHLKAFGVLRYKEKSGSFFVDFNKGFNTDGKKKFKENKELNDFFISKNESIVVEEIKNTHYNKNTKEIIDLLSSLKVEVLTPLNLKNKTIGLIALGHKESGDMYNDEDLEVMKTISVQAAIAIENALLYKETLDFGFKLKEEIKKATSNLLVANEKLRKLDKAKSEFISIASHQLRTPLTVIKGYISMILEGSFGKLKIKQKEALKKVFASGERLIQLVENLLNISRIESGRMQFNYEEVSLEEAIENLLDQLKLKAEKKNIKLLFKKINKIEKIKIDKEKISQVIINLVDNAIKYTEKGKVEISLEKKAKKIIFCVKDSGIGINKDNLPNLFRKFSREAGVFTVNREGTGLGLYVAKKIIEQHKGEIWAKSKGSGEGSEFCFSLPT
jgi:signal transduction histidine kinase